MTQIGHNTVASEQLTSFIERIERNRVDKKACTDLEAAILAEAKSDGFVPSAIKHMVKLRAMKPHQLQEAEGIIDTYRHALGMDSEPPLFRLVNTMNVDTASRESVIESLKQFVPDNGSIIVEAEGKPVRLTRDKDGQVSVSEVVEPPPRAASGLSTPRGPAAPAVPEPPQVDADTAEALGRSAYRDNQPIIKNPFPFGDDRRQRWDAGWRAESGSDGMGPGDDDE